MKILLIPNYSRPAATAAAVQLDAWLKHEGVEVAWAPDKKKEPDAVCTAEDCDLVVTLGGDGTLLRGARIVNYSEVPLVGISYGHLGFLTCATIGDDIVQLVADAIAGWEGASRDKMSAFITGPVNEYMGTTVPGIVTALAELLKANADQMEQADQQIADNIPASLS